MTPQNEQPPRTDSLLEEILQHVRAIDQNVDDILDRLGDQLDETRYRTDWYGNGLGDHGPCE